MSLSPGTRLGHYDVTSLLGEGGMGQVWQATDRLGRDAAETHDVAPIGKDTVLILRGLVGDGQPRP